MEEAGHLGRLGGGLNWSSKYTSTAFVSEPRNPGTGTYGFVIYHEGRKLAEGEGLAGIGVTNNYAEYTALVESLKKLRQLKVRGDILVKSDSQLLIGQMSKGWSTKGGAYLQKLKEARDLLKEFGKVSFEWIPREKNSEADLLSRIAYEQHRRSADQAVKGRPAGASMASTFTNHGA